MGAPENEMGTFVTAVGGIRGAYHAGWYYSRVTINGGLVTQTIEVVPTNELGDLARGIEGLKELYGIPSSAFGPMHVKEREFSGDVTEGIRGAIKTPLAQDIYGDRLGSRWNKITDTYSQAGKFTYRPVHNSNSIAYVAGKNAGYAWPYSVSTSGTPGGAFWSSPEPRVASVGRPSNPPDHYNIRTGREFPSTSPPPTVFWTPGAGVPLQAPSVAPGASNPTSYPGAFDPGAVHMPDGNYAGNWSSPGNGDQFVWVPGPTQSDPNGAGNGNKPLFQWIAEPTTRYNLSLIHI